jgi:hypothetical protein
LTGLTGFPRIYRIGTPARSSSRCRVYLYGIGKSESGAKTARRGRLALPWKPLRYRVGRTVPGEPGCHPQQNPFLLILVFPPEGGTTNRRNPARPPFVVPASAGLAKPSAATRRNAGFKPSSPAVSLRPSVPLGNRGQPLTYNFTDPSV